MGRLFKFLVRGKRAFAYSVLYLEHALGVGKRHHRRIESLRPMFEHYKLTCAASLDIGSGPNPKNPFMAASVHGVDIRENLESNVVYGDLMHAPLPFNDATFDYVTAHDFLEHIPRVISNEGKTRFPFIELMNEIFRVLKPNGILFVIQPAFPSREAFQDPTHVNIMTEDTMSLYFCETSWARIYGFVGSFKLLDDGWLGGKYFAFMRKTSDYPVRDLDFVQRNAS